MRISEMKEAEVVNEEVDAETNEEDLYRAVQLLEQFSDILGYASNRKLNKKMSKSLRKSIRGLCRESDAFLDEFADLS